MFMDSPGEVSKFETQFWVNDVLQYETRTAKLSLVQQETEIKRRFLDFHDMLCETVLGFREITTKS